MKKRILLFTVAAGFAIVSLTSSQNGAGAHAGYNCTGAETGSGNQAGCSAPGGSCHSTAATAGITVAIEIDSAGIAISSTSLGAGHYTPGTTYTVKITGTNTTTGTLPKFGFQASCIKGSTAVASPINAGSWGTVSGTLQNTAAIPGYFVCNLVEHSTPKAATTLGGGTGGTYVVSFPWTAPAIGTGTVSLWSALNAVDGDGNANTSDKWNTNHIVLNETDTVSKVAVASITNTIGVSAFPNPVSDQLNLHFINIQKGNYSIQVFDLDGKCISNENMELNGNQAASLNTTNWAPGIYQVVIQKDGINKIVRVVKNL